MSDKHQSNGMLTPISIQNGSSSSPFPSNAALLSAEKWSIATYLRIKPFDGPAAEQIIYDLQGIAVSIVFLFLLINIFHRVLIF
jgi:hypothetical protein